MSETQRLALANAQATAFANAIPSGPLDNIPKMERQSVPQSDHPIYESETFNGAFTTIATEEYNKLRWENEHQRAELERISKEHAAFGNKLKERKTDYKEVEKDYLLLQKKNRGPQKRACFESRSSQKRTCSRKVAMDTKLQYFQQNATTNTGIAGQLEKYTRTTGDSRY